MLFVSRKHSRGRRLSTLLVRGFRFFIWMNWTHDRIPFDDLQEGLSRLCLEAIKKDMWWLIAWHTTSTLKLLICRHELSSKLSNQPSLRKVAMQSVYKVDHIMWRRVHRQTVNAIFHPLVSTAFEQLAITSKLIDSQSLTLVTNPVLLDRAIADNKKIHGTQGVVVLCFFNDRDSQWGHRRILERIYLSRSDVAVTIGAPNRWYLVPVAKLVEGLTPVLNSKFKYPRNTTIFWQLSQRYSR